MQRDRASLKQTIAKHMVGINPGKLNVHLRLMIGHGRKYVMLGALTGEMKAW